MKKRDIVVMMAAIMAAGACTSEREGQVSEPVAIKLTASLGRVAQTRGADGRVVENERTVTRGTQDTELASGEKVYVWAKEDDGSWDYLKGWTLTAGESGALNGSSQYYPLDGTGITMNAVHGNFSSVLEEGSTDIGTLTHSVEADQSEPDPETPLRRYEKSDLLWGTATGSDASTTENIPFVHKLAKIEVNLSAGYGYTSSDLVDAVVTLNNVKPTVTINPADGSLGSASGDATTITTRKTGTLYEAVIPPQTFANPDALIAVTMNGITSTVPNDVATFNENTRYVYNVALSNSHDYSGISIGDIIYHDGSWSTPADVAVRKASGFIPIAVVFSTNPSAYDRDVTKNKIGSFTHGYAMALKEDENEAGYEWATTNPSALVTDAFIPTNGNVSVSNWTSTISVDYDGLKHCNSIKEKINNGTYSAGYFLAYECARDHKPIAPDKTSGWYLPSIGQLYLWLTQFGSAVSLGTPTNNQYFSDPNYQYVYWNSVTTAVREAMNTYLSTGHCLLTSGEDFTPFVGGADNTHGGSMYYSSTERRVAQPYFLSFYHPGGWLSCGVGGGIDSPYVATGKRRVRAVFAF